MKSDWVHAEEELWPGLDRSGSWGGNWSLRAPGYLLSPKTSIITDSHLPRTTLINLLVKSPKVTRATLRFKVWDDASVVVGWFLGLNTAINLPSTENEPLCPILSEPRLEFDWTLPCASKGWLIDAVKTRREAGFLATLSIYARWTGEKTYLLLTGDQCDVDG
jgi:hypothetical protein